MDVAVFGLILMVAIIVLPQGIAGALARLSWRREKSAPPPVPTEVAHG